MSESVGSAGASSAGATGSATSASTSTPQGGQAPVGNKPMSFTPGQGQQQSQGQTEAAQARELGDQDMDALVRVKVNGEEKRIPLKEALKLSQLEQASHEKMRQAAEERKRIQAEWQREQARLKEIKSNPEKLAEYLGLDLDSFAEERLARKYELQQMDPNQRRALELEQKLKSYETQENQTKQGLLDQIKDVVGNVPEGAERATKEQLQAYLQQQKQVYAQEQQRYNAEIAAAWKEMGLPAYSSVGKDIAFQMLKAQKSGRSLQPKEAAAIVKEERLTTAREILTSMDAKAIQEFLGQELVQKLREFDVERVTQTKGPQFNQQNSPAPAASKDKPQYIGQLEWRKANGLS